MLAHALETLLLILWVEPKVFLSLIRAPFHRLSAKFHADYTPNGVHKRYGSGRKRRVRFCATFRAKHWLAFDTTHPPFSHSWYVCVDIVGKTWQLHHVSPLWRLSTTDSSLTAHSQGLSTLLSQVYIDLFVQLLRELICIVCPTHFCDIWLISHTWHTFTHVCCLAWYLLMV